VVLQEPAACSGLYIPVLQRSRDLLAVLVSAANSPRRETCYGAETLRDNSLRCIENLRLLIVFCLGLFWYTQQLYCDSRFRLYISHGTDTIMTHYDTGSTEIPFGAFDVCIWVSPFLVQDSPIEGTPNQCPSCGIFAEPLN
jgi:hypothetical protein